MLISDLYDRTLIKPSLKSDSLYIVSGYASAIFARRHLQDLLEHSPKTRVNLIVGMSSQKNDHLAFVQLHKEFAGRFQAYYYAKTPQVHCKVYGWFSGSNSVVGFAGSANYSQMGFFENQQRNQLSFEDPNLIRDLYQQLLRESEYIPSVEADVPHGHTPTVTDGDVDPGQIEWEIPNTRVRISFLDARGNLPQKSGLNWGQRQIKSRGRGGVITWRPRAKNEAYLSLKKESREDSFLPPRAIRFTLITDDGYSFDCSKGQGDEGKPKGLSTYNDNTIIGRYLRQRIGVPDGQLVTKDDLIKYGRTDYTIEKLDDETFLLDLSVRKKG